VSVSTGLARRGFLALACGLLVPAPARLRAYSFGPLYENFVEFVDGRQVGLRLRSRLAEVELWSAAAAGHVWRPGAEPPVGTATGLVNEIYETARSVLGEPVARIVAGGAEGRYFGGELILGSFDAMKLVSIDLGGPPRHISPRYVEPV
jgi:hypothetical protein